MKTYVYFERHGHKRALACHSEREGWKVCEVLRWLGYRDAFVSQLELAQWKHVDLTDDTED